jgi:hypothetical protein
MTTSMIATTNFSETLIASQTLSAPASSFTTVSLPSGYSGFRVSVIGGVSANPTEIRLRLNGLATAVYSTQSLIATSATVSGLLQSGDTSALLFDASTSSMCCDAIITNSTTGAFGGRSNGGDAGGVSICGFECSGSGSLTSLTVLTAGGNLNAGTSLKVSAFK